MTDFFKVVYASKYKKYLFLLLPTLLLYSKSIGYGFSPMDEQWMLVDNEWFISKWNNVWKAFTGPGALLIYFRPLFVLSTFIDYQFGKLNPQIFHVTNLVLHLLCVVLLHKLLLQFKSQKPVAFWLSLVFALHPMALHAVAWIPGRNDSMLCLFFLASILSLNDFLESRSSKHFFLHVLFFSCALLTKETAFVLPLLFVLTAVLNTNLNLKNLRMPISVWFTLLLLGLLARYTALGAPAPFDTSSTSIFKNILFAFLVNTGKVLLPLQQSVYPLLENSLVWPGLITLLALIAVFVLNKVENKRRASLGLCYYFILLLLPLSISAMKTAGEQYEHRLYTPMVGLLLFVSQLKIKWKSPSAELVFAGIAVLFAALTSKRMAVYKDQSSFLEAAIVAAPNNYFFYFKKAHLYDARGDYRNAVALFSEALKKNPNSDIVYFDRGNANFSLGNKEAALSDYTNALKRAKPASRPNMLKQRCYAYSKFDEPDLALADLNKLKTCCPSLITASFAKEIEIRAKKSRVG